MDASISDAIERAGVALKRARRVVAITGAGISAESGVPTFRGKGGLWRSYRAEDLATPEAFARDPVLVWEWYLWRRGRIAGVRPNPGHDVLARFETRFPAFTTVTQNVDGLHAAAGSRNLVELHGNIWRARCSVHVDRVVDQRGEPIPPIEENAGRPVAWLSRGDLPRCPACAAPLRPDVVWFGEPLDRDVMARAVEAAATCEVALVVGTSGIVYPAAGLPSVARRAGATVVEVNVDATPLTEQADVVLRGPSGVILPELERRL